MGVKAADVSEFVRFLVQFSGIYNVDDDGYVVDKINDDKPVLAKVGNQYKRLQIIKETITDNDAVVINPLNENITETVDSKWLYTTLNVGLSRRVVTLARFLKMVIETEAAKHGSKNDEENDQGIDFSSEVIAFASKHKEFDDKVLDAFELISKKRINFINVWYNRKQKNAHFRCNIYDPDVLSEYPQIGKKVWKVITSFMGDILGVSKTDITLAARQIDELYTTSTDLITVPKLHSILGVFMKIYTRLNKFLSMCEVDDEDFVVDLTTLGHHIENLEEYYQKTKWFSTTSVSNIDRPAIKTIEGNVPVVPTNIPSNPFTGHTTPGFVEPESNIPSNPFHRGGIGGPLEYAQVGGPSGCSHPQPLLPNTNFPPPVNIFGQPQQPLFGQQRTFGQQFDMFGRPVRTF
jgi:hypothetical protein